MKIKADIIKEYKTEYDKKERLTDGQKVAEVFKSVLNVESEIDQDKEHFWVAGLTTKNTIKYIDLVSLGTINASLVAPRETFRKAVHEGAAAIILCHNHPSGDTKPSQEDILLTRRLVEAGKILGIAVLDHVIIGGNSDYALIGDYYSFRNNGLIGG